MRAAPRESSYDRLNLSFAEAVIDADMDPNSPATADHTNAATGRKRRPPAWLFALGHDTLPEEVQIDGAVHHRVGVFKHDFFAATGLYEGPLGKVVMKVGRKQSFYGLPLAWIGRFLVGREHRIYQCVHDLPGVPKCYGMYGRNGFFHEFVEGRELCRDDRLADDFFPRLSALLEQIHARDIAYVDLEKRENILVGDDGRPYLIDFQISWDRSVRAGRRGGIGRIILSVLQRSDRYHLLKHWRRLRPDQLTAEQVAAAQPPFWIAWHRLLFRPFTLLRRWILEKLGARPRAGGKLAKDGA